MDPNADHLAVFNGISGKLKKRFLKKPNLAEGSEHFASLAKVFKQEDCPQYAGLCCMARARCEHSLANAAAESQSLVEAARLFLEAEADYEQLASPSFGEHLVSAINCYEHAVKVTIDAKEPVLAASFCTELGAALKRFGKPGEALVHFQRAAELQSQSPMDCLRALAAVASCKMAVGDHEGALMIYTEMEYLAQERGGLPNESQPLGSFCDVLIQCEVSRVLLLMLLQPSPQRLRPEHALTLEKYAWEYTNDDDPILKCMDEDLFLLLQSVVMACQARDTETLRALQADLWYKLSPDQNELVHRIIVKLSKSVCQFR